MLTVGCAAPRLGPGWGDRASLWVSGERIGKSLLGASLDPRFWIPAAGALVFAIRHFDEKTSDWAIERHPIFGSDSGAEDASNIVLGVLGAETLVTLGLTPTGSESSGWLNGRTKGILVELAAFGATAGTTEALKDVVARERPQNEVLTSSFPSGHASESFSMVTLLDKNYEAMGLDPSTRGWIQTGNTVIAGLGAWARVEAGKHFPSDILAGAALGHLVTSFVHDVLMGEELKNPPLFDFAFGRGSASMDITWRF